MKWATTATVVLAICGLAAGDFVTELWGNGPLCQHQDALKVEGQVGEFNLSALPKGANIQRAVLRAKIDRRGYQSTIQICPLKPGQSEPPDDAKPLALIGPRYTTFDATQAVREAVVAGAPLKLFFKAAPGWGSGSTSLEIAYAGQAPQPTPKVADLRAVHHDGQTFLTWKEHEDILADDEPVTIEKMEKKLLPLRGKQDCVYRVYTHDKPIDAASIAEAAMIAEVPFVLSAYYLDSINTIEHPNPANGEGSTPLIGGARAKRQTVPRYVVAKGQEPLPRGSGLYVRTITKPGATYYAVVTAINGAEAVGGADLGPGNSLAQPVAEQAAPPIPVPQSTQPVKNDRGGKGWTVTTYNYWLEFPYSNVPRQLAVGTRQADGMEPTAKGLLWVQLGAYGSQPIFNANSRGGGDVAICPPWDQDDSILQGQHECMGTLRSYDQGVVHNWGQRRTLALVEWAKKEFPVDPERIVVEGQFPLWALRYPDIFAAVAGDAYGNFNKGREAQKHGLSWGPYPKGSKNFAGVDQWDYMNIAKFIRENPTVELPYYVSRPTGSSHVGDIGPWAWPELYRALHDTKRAFSTRWGGAWGGISAAGAHMLGRVKLHQSLPAFGRCSLDGCPGDGELNPGGVGGDGDPVGDINGWLVWDADTITDEPDAWEMTIWLLAGDAKTGQPGAPQDSCTVDVTPRRCQKLKAKPGDTFTWTTAAANDAKAIDGKAIAGKAITNGQAKPDANGLVTVEGLTMTKVKTRLAIKRK